MSKKSFILITIILLVILIFIWVLYFCKTEKSISTSSELLNTNKIEWGIKRGDNHNQPDVGTVNKKLMEESDSIYLGNKDKKVIYLTFDLGYEAGYTEDILNTLKENEVTATFFVTAHYINTASELAQKMIDNQDTLANHTSNHKSMPTLDENTLKEEIMKLHDAVKEKFNYEMKYIRPPKGEFSQKSLALTKELGYKTVMWSFAYADWDENNQPNPEDAKKKIMDNLHNGEVMLLHATSKTNRDILGDVIKEIKNNGYEIKSLDEFQK